MLTALPLSRLLFLVLAIVVAVGPGCSGQSFRLKAVGTNGAITVVIDSVDWNGRVGELVRSRLSPIIETFPMPERMFELESRSVATQSDYDRVTAQKNLVFVASLEDSSGVARILESAFSPGALDAVRRGQPAFVVRDDLWRRDQNVVYLAAATTEQLEELVDRAAPEIRDLFNRAERERLEADMFGRGRQHDLEAILMESHDFRVQVQHDYLIAADTTSFVWLRRILADTWRSVFVHYIEYANPVLIEPDWIYAIRDSLARTFLRGNVGGFVQTDYRRPLETREVDFLDRYALETRGLWHMVGPDDEGEIVEYGMGGPFVNYTFYDQESGRIYMIDGMVFAPGFEKREFVRQLEVIAYTFASRADTESQVVADSRHPTESRVIEG